MLSVLLLLPIIGSLLLLTIPENTIENKIRMKRITLISMIINFLISIYIWLEFDSNTSQYQFVYEFIDLSYCHLNIGIDGISLYFVLLTTFISPIAVLSNYNNINNNLKYFLISEISFLTWWDNLFYKNSPPILWKIQNNSRFSVFLVDWW